MDISLVIPLYNEEESLIELCDWILKVMSDNKFSYEIILIDDGSKDASWSKIVELSQKNKDVKGIRFRKNYGKSAALNCGFETAAGDVVVTMDADMQDSPDEIPVLFRMVKEEGYDLVSGWKKKRHDPVIKTIPSRFFNWITKKVSSIYLHDFNCGLKSYKKEVVKNIEIYGEMHRYIPVIAKWNGFHKIGEKEVLHRPRKYGESKFGFERFINGFLDLLSISFVSKFGKRPMHFFGTFGVFSFIIGLAISLWLIGEKIYNTYYGLEVRNVAEQPLFFLSLVAVIVGVQLFLTGFIGEMLVQSSPKKNTYIIADKIGTAMNL